MKRLLSIVAASLVLAHAPGNAQSNSFHQWFADTGRIACSSWRSPATASGALSTGQYLHDETVHAWAYGFVVGAAYEPRQPRLIVENLGR